MAEANLKKAKEAQEVAEANLKNSKEAYEVSEAKNKQEMVNKKLIEAKSVQTVEESHEPKIEHHFHTTYVRKELNEK